MEGKAFVKKLTLFQKLPLGGCVIMCDKILIYAYKYRPVIISALKQPEQLYCVYNCDSKLRDVTQNFNKGPSISLRLNG